MAQDGPVDCAAVAVVLQEYLDAELDERDATRVAEHLELCRRCGLSAETYRSIKWALARAGQPDRKTLDRLHHFAETIADRYEGSASTDA
jgi:predicted anti-sigma-YlaC factor YlaD